MAGWSKVNVELNVYELRSIRSALGLRIRKYERVLAEHPFVPEPGRINVNEEGLKNVRALADRISALLDEVGGR